ncbi:hypothetical protein [Nonomuraea sp. NPDC003754]
MKRFFGDITPRERRFALAGTVIALVIFMPFLAFADPSGLIPGSGPGQGPAPIYEQPVDVERGDSCRDLLPSDTPTFVSCTWLTPPQDALEVAAFWAADGGARMEAAQPLPTEYMRCNQRTDLSKASRCKGGQTHCKQRPDGWYRCHNEATGKVTYERHVDGTKQVRTTAPPATANPSSAPSTAPTMTSIASPQPLPTVNPADTMLPADGDAGVQQVTAPAIGQPTVAPTAESVDGAATDGPTPTPAAPETGTEAVPSTGQPATRPAPAGQKPAAVATAIEAARASSLRVWVEADLNTAYGRGQAAYTTALNAVIAAAQRPGVIGVKFAESLGFRDMASESEVRAFLTKTSAALRQALPGKRLAIGVVVPELGCGSSKKCIATMRAKYPLVTKRLVDRYIKTNVTIEADASDEKNTLKDVAAVDRIQIASGLFGAAYGQHQVTHKGKSTPITPALAAQAQWLSVKALSWDALVQVGAREYGLAHAGEESAWDTTTASNEIDARVGNAIGLGAQTVTLWGHKAADDSRTYRLLNAGLATNRVWQTLAERGLKSRLSVVIDPTSTETSIEADIAAFADTISEVYIKLS